MHTFHWFQSITGYNSKSQKISGCGGNGAGGGGGEQAEHRIFRTVKNTFHDTVMMDTYYYMVVLTHRMYKAKNDH